MSHVDIRKVTNFKKYSGREFQFKILKLDERNKTGVVSRRRVLEEENKEKVAQLMEEIEVGQELKGVVVSILDYGLFVDIGGINGFLHKNELSYGKVGHPKEKFRKGDEITVMVIDFNKDENKITLGYKQRFPNPWENIEKKYPVGERFKARVTKILSFGAFIELEEGVEGLLHISDLTWEGTPDTVEDYVAVGDELWVQVIDLNPEEKKIKLGLKQLELRPEEKYIENHGKGEVITAKVKKILKTVVFVGLEENVEGIIKISDIKYFRIDSPADYLSEGQEIQAMILSDELDKNYKVKLGLKQIEDDAWKEFFNTHKVGSVIKVTVKKIMNNGVKVRINDAIEGFVRIGEISKKRIEPEEIAQEVNEGEEREALVVSTQADRKRINLSFKAVTAKKEKEDIEKYMKSDDTKSITTIGDLLETEMDKKKK
jgi:small subunit ribosomal protein S1